MAQETIREFLVKLGFATDEPALKKFSDGITRATKTVVVFSAAVGAMATTAAVGIQKLALGMEGLFFSAQRTGSTAANLKALQVAAANFGATAEEVQSSVEGLAAKLRETPGLKAVLGGVLGTVGATVSTDNVLNVANLGKFFQSLKEKYGDYGVALAENYRQQFGIDEHTMLAIMNPKLGSGFNKQLQNLGGTGGWWDKAVEDAHRFEGQMRTLTTVMEGFGAQVFDALEKKLNVSLPKLTVWLQHNGPRLASELATGIGKIYDWVNKVIPVVKEWADKFLELDKRTGGWLVRVLAIGVALKALGAIDIVTGLAGMASAVVKLGAAFAIALVSINPVVTAIVAIGTAVTAAVVGLKYLNEHYPDNILNRNLQSGTPQQQADAALSRLENENGGPPAGTGGVSGWLQRFVSKYGPSADVLAGQAAGGGYIDTGDSAQATKDYLMGTGRFNPALQNMHPITAPSLQPAGVPRELHQNVTIHVDGAQDPTQTGRAIQRALQDMARNSAAGGVQ